jgi:hypothetical protein
VIGIGRRCIHCGERLDRAHHLSMRILGQEGQSSMIFSEDVTFFLAQKFARRFFSLEIRRGETCNDLQVRE